LIEDVTKSRNDLISELEFKYANEADTINSFVNQAGSKIAYAEVALDKLRELATDLTSDNRNLRNDVKQTIPTLSL